MVLDSRILEHRAQMMRYGKAKGIEFLVKDLKEDEDKVKENIPL